PCRLLTQDVKSANFILAKCSTSNRRGADRGRILAQPQARSPTAASRGLPSHLAGEETGVRGRVGGGPIAIQEYQFPDAENRTHPIAQKGLSPTTTQARQLPHLYLLNVNIISSTSHSSTTSL